MAPKVMRPGRSRQKPSRRQHVARLRRAGTPIQDHRTSNDERTYTDVEIDDSGNRVTPTSSLPVTNG